MECFQCPECPDDMLVEVTEEETHDGVTRYMGICPRHDDVSITENWRNP